MQFLAFLLFLTNGYKTYASVTLAVISGLGMILTRNYGGSASEIFQALLIIFSGTAVASLRHAVGEVPDRVIEAAGRD